jgi:hypothetical protein
MRRSLLSRVANKLPRILNLYQSDVFVLYEVFNYITMTRRHQLFVTWWWWPLCRYTGWGWCRDWGWNHGWIESRLREDPKKTHVLAAKKANDKESRSKVGSWWPNLSRNSRAYRQIGGNWEPNELGSAKFIAACKHGISAYVHWCWALLQEDVPSWMSIILKGICKVVQSWQGDQ